MKDKLPKDYSVCKDSDGFWRWICTRVSQEDVEYAEYGPPYRDKDKAIINAWVDYEQLALDKLNNL